jgi:hypothetical protein
VIRGATTRRQRERQELLVRARALPGDDARRIGLFAVAFTFAASALELALLAVAVRAARRGWRHRRAGARAMADAARSRPLLVLACCYAGYRAAGRSVAVRWARRALQESERDAAAPPA